MVVVGDFCCSDEDCLHSAVFSCGFRCFFGMEKSLKKWCKNFDRLRARVLASGVRVRSSM